jgi:hypothetical protein
MHKFAPLPNILTPTLDASETVEFIPELCEKSRVNIVCIDAFLEEKANDHSLLEVHILWQNPKRTRPPPENDLLFKLPHDL